MGSVRDRPLNAQQLVQLCVDSFDGDESASDLPNCLFASHSWFMDSSELLAHFIAAFQETRDVAVRRRVCVAVGAWIRLFPMHFDGHPQLCSLVVRLRAISEDVPEEVRNRLDVNNIPSYAWMRAVSVRHPVARQVSLSFEQWSPEDISTSLSHIDFKMLARIPISELKRYVKEGSLAGTPFLERSISVFNNLTNWVQCMILSKVTPRERADIMIKFINVGNHLLHLRNFNTLMAVLGGISHSNISRLNSTNSLLPCDMRKDLATLSNLLSFDNNFAAYRAALMASGNQFRIPIVGVHLKDLIAIQGCTGDLEKSRQISVRKLRKLASILAHFHVFHHRPALPDANTDLINTLRVSLDIRYNEDDIYELSLRREPRSFIGFESSSHPVVFAEWASGVTVAPDPDTVNKHVTAMVDAVFKHYDHDRDGYISQAEFRQISGNFPFIDPFGTIDLDRDGQISKEELKAYFVKANKDSIAFRKGFKHDFHETTFLTPTSCGHCGKLLWGLIRQGCKCKDCGLAVHGCCKENAVAECRRRSTGLAEWLNPRGGRNASFRDRLFLHYNKTGTRFRTVSTVSSSPEPPADHAGSSKTSVACVQGRQLELPLQISPRPQSESNDCYHKSHRMSPEDEPLVSLACEEVFDDDSSSTIG